MFIKPEEFIDSCYDIFLQRPADRKGKQNYLKAINSGQSYRNIMRSFLDSQEFKQKQLTEQISDDNKRQFISNLYNYLLRRKPSEIEIDFWVKHPLNYHELLCAFGQSEEYKKLTAEPNNLYGVILKSDEIDSYLVYPSFDKVQLQESLTGHYYQLSDFLACMNFLKQKKFSMSPKTCFLDLGANVGSTSIYALEKEYFERAICIEASALNYQFLIFNTQINQLTNKLENLNYGLADFIGEGELICSPDNCGDFRIQPVNPNIQTKNLYNEDKYTRESAQFITLDELMSQGILNPEEIGFIWIDCQGSEGLIFKGGENFFKATSVPLYIEFWPYGINQLAGKEYYFSLLSNYSSEIWRLIEGKYEQINIDFLELFYNQSLDTQKFIDILVLPQ